MPSWNSVIPSAPLKIQTTGITSGIDASGKYQDVIDSLSNEYEFNRMINKPGLNFRYNKKKVSYALGSSLAFNHNLQKDRHKRYRL
jgi:hypothetical protein